MARFLVGVNYWPRSSGTAMWTHFDLTEVDEDFARIASLGLSVVRVFLTWEAFAPAWDTVAVEPLDDFIALLDAAYGRALRVIPSLFFGHASGANWIPAWALDRERRADATTIVGIGTSPWSAGDFYTGDLLEAQRGLARALGVRAREHAAILAWDLGNAFAAVRAPASQGDLEHWNGALTHDLYDTSNIGVTASLRATDIAGAGAFDLEPLGEAWKFPSFAALGAERLDDFARFVPAPGPLETIPFLCEALALRARHAPFVTSFGIASGDAAGFARNALDRMQRAGALGALWWRWSDDTPERRDLPPLDEAPAEASYGIIGADGREKPVARELGAFASERRPVAVPPPLELPERALREEVGNAFVAYREIRNSSEEHP